VNYQQAFGNLRFAYQVSDRWASLSNNQKIQVIKSCSAKEASDIAWVIASSHPRVIASAMARGLNIDLAVLAISEDPEWRAIAASQVRDECSLQSLANDHIPSVREVLLSNPRASLADKEAAARGPKGFITVNQSAGRGELWQWTAPGFPSASWGTGIYRVNHDGSETCVSSSWDSSG
jgi:hypothetical protein